MENEMDWLEGELKQALAPKLPSADFAARVHAAARRRAQAPARRWMGAAAALLVIGSSGGAALWRHHQGMVAKDQVMLAMRITADKLNQIQTRVREVRP
jgi:hypothetical protein